MRDGIVVHQDGTNGKDEIDVAREEAEQPAERDLAGGVSINGEPMRAALGQYWKELGQHILLLLK